MSEPNTESKCSSGIRSAAAPPFAEDGGPAAPLAAGGTALKVAVILFSESSVGDGTEGSKGERTRRQRRQEVRMFATRGRSGRKADHRKPRRRPPCPRRQIRPAAVTSAASARTTKKWHSAVITCWGLAWATNVSLAIVSCRARYWNFRASLSDRALRCTQTSTDQARA